MFSLFPCPLPLGLFSWAALLDFILQPCCCWCFNFSFHIFNDYSFLSSVPFFIISHSCFMDILLPSYLSEGTVYFSSICFVFIFLYSLYYLCFYLATFCVFVFPLSCWKLSSNVKCPGCLLILMNEAIKTWIKLYVWGQCISWGFAIGSKLVFSLTSL